EVKTVLSTFDDYICGTDDRYYLNNQLAGYVGDGNAYNLNSRGTLSKANFDGNIIWRGYSKYLDGDGIRFWYKGSGGIIQFALDNDTIKYTSNLSGASTGKWITIYYKDLVSNGDLSNINKIYYKTAGNTNANYIDELHTIQQKIGDVTYELNGDGTASVVGYNLRLENVEILSEYQGCPVTTIKAGALSNSLTLRSVNLPDSITTIEENAFENNPNLKTVTFGNNLKTIKENAFKNCVALTDITIPNSVTSISDTAFSGCSNLYVNINSNHIKNYCVKNSIDYKDYFENIYYYFDYATNGNLVKILGYNGTKTQLTIPLTVDNANVTTIEANAFKDKNTLESITMEGVVYIQANAFSGCTALKEVNVTDSVATIGESAFANCTAIETFYFGDNISSIGTDAFKNCDFIADLSDNAYISRNSYSYIYVKNNKYKNYPTTDSDYIYYIVNEIATITSYKGLNKDVKIPAKIDEYVVETIAKEAFKDNTNLETVVFNGNVRVIDEYAFYGCVNLNNVIFDDSLRKILGFSFKNCPSLLKVNLNDIVSINENAFDSTTTILRIQTDFVRNALDYVDGMTAGWNMGNTLDGHSYDYSYGDLTVSQHEHLARWYNYISQDLFDLVAESFNTIRIPITWNVFVNPNDDYKIDKEFMDRIQEVVDMCYTAGFEYIIINTHHDSDYYFNVHPSNPDYDDAEYILSRVWEQICERFEDYDEKLIFESMNEIRAQDLTTESDGNGDWYGHDTTYFDKLNSLNKSFYQTVRASGGNNNRRYLMIQTYGGQKDFHQINKLWLPSVSSDDHIIPSVHWYIESSNAAHYYAVLDGLTQKFLDKGMPCVIGEIGLARWINDDQREVWVNTAFTLFEQYGIKAIIWEDHGDYSTVDYNGGDYKWKYPKYISTINAITKKRYNCNR
ncbi:MAG: leucine-rich repeat protein, partial [Clostridia bacterium]|nr:leucine-rich repeat protein [Clostridia bacterium]